MESVKLTLAVAVFEFEQSISFMFQAATVHTSIEALFNESFSWWKGR